MRVAVLAHEADVAGWRRYARAAIAANLAPGDLRWSTDDAHLFEPLETARAAPYFKVPRGFVELADEALLHSDLSRFDLFYRLLWRLRDTPRLLEDASDADVHRARLLAKAVHRDIHKMHAFVRFKEVEDTDGVAYAAWFEPEHHIVAAAATHFVERFASMRWAIFTPRRCAIWDGAALRFEPGSTRAAVPETDRLDAHWRAYYRSIFNPARVKVKAMTKEMPKKYWHNLPETAEVAPLLRAAAARTATMIAVGPSAPSAMAQVEARRRPVNLGTPGDGRTLDTLRAEADACRRCPLADSATQVVFGEGPADARLMIVGEQPGDQEDIAGRPFVGPAGQVLDRALAEAGIDRAAAYITNAVKHFKFELRGKRRIHQTPKSGEVDHCRWWLARERAAVRPKLIIALGATAGRAVLQRPVRIGAERGRPLPAEEGGVVWLTVHPSYLLRLPDEAARRAETARFIADLAAADAWLKTAPAG